MQPDEAAWYDASPEERQTLDLLVALGITVGTPLALRNGGWRVPVTGGVTFYTVGRGATRADALNDAHLRVKESYRG